MTTLIILAHPGSTSFNAQWAQATAAACDDEVIWSDLCSMGFDPVEKASHYGASSEHFDPLSAQSEAAEANKLPADVEAEIAKVRAADRIIFHFPLWWFGPPAIVKGWADRCLTHGAMHRSDARFDTGLCQGKEALKAQREVISGWDARPSISFNADSDFDREGRLKSVAPSHSAFIRSI